MQDVQVKLSALWIALMLTYLLGDVLRIYSGDYKARELAGVRATQEMWLGIAALMVVSIPHGRSVFGARSAREPLGEHVAAILLFGFNVIGLPTYPSAYDKFLIVVGLVFNVVTVWYAWNWD